MLANIARRMIQLEALFVFTDCQPFDVQSTHPGSWH